MLGSQKDGSRRQSVEMEVPIKMPTQEKLEAMEQQRRSSMQTRRASLAEVIPDWPTLQKRKVFREVQQRNEENDNTLTANLTNCSNTVLNKLKTVLILY